MTSKDRSRGTRILAKSVFRQLRSQGYDWSQIATFAAEVLSLLASSIVTERAGLSAERAVAAMAEHLDGDAEGADEASVASERIYERRRFLRPARSHPAS